jgi:hypothetical protein
VIRYARPAFIWSISAISRSPFSYVVAAIRRAWTFRLVDLEDAISANPHRPAIDRNLLQRILFKSGGVSADADQQPSLGGLADDRMKRTRSPQISMEKCGRRGSIQCRKHLFALRPPDAHASKGGNLCCESP